MPDRVEVHGAGKTGTDFIETPTANETMLAALRDERSRYEERQRRGETHYAGEDISEIIGKIDGQLAYYGTPTIGEAVVTLATIAEVVEEVIADKPDAKPLDPDAPPHEGWVRDRVTGEWRAPKPRGRKPAGEGAQSGSESTPISEE